MKQEFAKSKELTDNTEVLFTLMTPLFNNLYNEIIRKINGFVEKGQEYLDERITKSELADEFASPLFWKSRENIAEFAQDLEDTIKDYNEEMTIGMEKLKNNYKHVLKIRPPVINGYKIYQLNLVKNATEINETIMRDIVNNLENNPEENIMALITETYKRLKLPFAEMKRNLLDSVDDMLEQISDLADLLSQYKTSTKMNTNFFM